MYKSELIALHGTEFEGNRIEKFKVLTSDTEIGNDFSTPELLGMKLNIARKFTMTYKDNIHEHIAVKEAKCLAEQYPAMCRDIVKGDLFAGRVHYFPLVGFGLECYSHSGVREISVDDVPGDKVPEEIRELRRRIGSSNTGFYFDYSGLKDAISVLGLEGSEKKEVEDIIGFWWEESSRYKYSTSLPKEITDNIGRTDFDLKLASTFFRVGCASVGFDPLLQKGIPGMKDYINKKKSSAAGDSVKTNLYEGMLMALDVLVSVCRYYETQALETAVTEMNGDRKVELVKMADVLDKLTWRKPENTREALQLFWLYSLLTGTLNYGRMDEYLGDFYVKDIDSGYCTEDDILKLLKSLWKMINDLLIDGLFNSAANNRIILGGKGRRNAENADRFALIAMEASRQTYFAEPNVTLRFHKGQNPLLMKKALDLIGEGCIHPTLYNDDAYIPYLSTAFNVSLEEAEHYIPEGCGEIVLDHRSIGSPNTIMNYLTLLDLVLHNGYYTLLGEQMGLKLGSLSDFDTFEKLLNAVKEQIHFTHGILARRQAIEVKVEGENIAHLFMSMLTDDCIEKGCTLMNHGARYLGGIIEAFGLTNLADSLCAIKELVFDKKAMTLEKLVSILDSDFKGYESERQMMLNVPKFGNDDESIDSLHTELTRFINQSANEQGKAAGFHYYLICNLNPGGVSYANITKASADGRHYGDPMSIGNAPTAGRDKNGITALLNSMLKHDKHHAGYVHNLKISKSMFAPGNRQKFEALVNTYFENGGIQLMITTLNPEDLKSALKEPEKYKNLIVRVGGWTSRYVELEPVYQMEILNRTLYS